MSAIADKLREARALIERGWTQREWARDAEGKGVIARDPRAQCWCLEGAITLADVKSEGKRLLERAIGTWHTISWNDAPDRTQAEVLTAFDKAIALAEADND